jgi:hypothetical protein
VVTNFLTNFFLYTCHEIIGRTAEQIVKLGLSELARTVPLSLGPTALTYIIFSGGKYNTPVILFLFFLLLAHQFVSFYLRLQALRGLHYTCVSTICVRNTVFVFDTTIFLPIHFHLQYKHLILAPVLSVLVGSIEY